MVLQQKEKEEDIFKQCSKGRLTVYIRIYASEYLMISFVRADILFGNVQSDPDRASFSVSTVKSEVMTPRPSYALSPLRTFAIPPCPLAH